MKVELLNHDIEVPYIVEKLMQRKVHKLKSMLRNYKPDDVSLNVDFSRIGKKRRYMIKVSLHLPSVTLATGDSHETSIGALGNAFRKLFKSVEQFKRALQRGAEYERKKGNALAIISRANIPSINQSRLAELFSSRYHQFYNYTLREIRFRCYEGFSKPGTITIRDILDDALANVAGRLNGHFSEKNVYRMCFSEIRRSIDRNLNPGGTGMIPIEQIIEPEAIDSEYQEYYQPDEIVKVEDIVIDENAEIPEQKIEYEEIESYIDRLLSQLPADWREAFILIEREGLTAEEIAKTRKIKVESVNRDLRMATSFLREKLVDAGFNWKSRT